MSAPETDAEWLSRSHTVAALRDLSAPPVVTRYISEGGDLRPLDALPDVMAQVDHQRDMREER